MQDCYVGDVGDFGKYALLRGIVPYGMRLAVIWYLKASRDAPNDGGLIAYPTLEPCDPVLYAALQGLIRAGRRNVAAVREAAVLPARTIFYETPVPDYEEDRPQARLARRRLWLRGAVDCARPAQVAFLDPDNGLEVRSCQMHHRKAAKYAFVTELRVLAEAGKSIIVYQHATRAKGGIDGLVAFWQSRLKDLPGIGHPWHFIFRRGQVRAYLVLPQRQHEAALARRSREFIAGPLGDQGHFQLHECP